MSHLCDVLGLPALSVQAPRLLSSIQSDDITIKELADHLRLDPGIGARLLHVANSPFFGVSGQVDCTEEAVMVLGMRRARDLIQVEVFKNLIQSPPWNAVDLSRLWKQGLVVAAAMQAMAARVCMADSAAFTTGLFHNLGCLVLLHASPEEYGRALQQQTCSAELIRLERELFFSDHAEMGASVLAQWHFPAHICEAVATQYLQPDAEHSVLQRLLQLSHCYTEGGWVAPPGLQGAFASVGLPPWGSDGLNALAIDVKAHAQHWLGLLGE